MSPEAVLGAVGILGFLGMLYLSFRLGRIVEHRDQRARLLSVDAELAELIQKFTSHVKREAGAEGRAKRTANRVAGIGPAPMSQPYDVEQGRAMARQMFRQRDAGGGGNGG